MMNYLNSNINGFIFLVRNCWYSFFLNDFSTLFYNKIEIRGMKRGELRMVNQLQRRLRDGKSWNAWRKILFYFFGSRLIVVASNNKNEVLGFQMLYFRSRESKENILHEAFIGIAPEYRGHKLSQCLRIFSINHLQNSKIVAISSEIEIKNIPSIKTALASGAQILNEQNGKYQVIYKLKK